MLFDNPPIQIDVWNHQIITSKFIATKLGHFCYGFYTGIYPACVSKNNIVYKSKISNRLMTLKPNLIMMEGIHSIPNLA